jgi:hypothetical protein
LGYKVEVILFDLHPVYDIETPLETWDTRMKQFTDALKHKLNNGYTVLFGGIESIPEITGYIYAVIAKDGEEE